MNKLKRFIVKQYLLELLKYDYCAFKFPLVLISYVLILINLALNRKLKAFSLVSSIYRTGWAGSHYLGIYFSRVLLKNKRLMKECVKIFIHNVKPLPNTAKFFKSPEKMLDGIVTVIKSPSENEKGVLVLNYSYYFLLFKKFYEVEEIAKNYIIILEPSWAGLCEISILSYASSNSDTYVMCYERRDLDFINALNCAIIPLEIGPSWFVNHTKFSPIKNKRDIDILMVAAWTSFKRHGAFFKAISSIKSKIRDPKVVLVGYPVDLEKITILELAEYYGIADCLEIYESVTHNEVSALLNRSKINVLWSKFEGNNRAIIEAMFCNTVVIMREGHNYGECYDFINQKTGMFANEKNLLDCIVDVISNYSDYSPREYVIQNRSCLEATKIMNQVISENELASGRNWTRDLVVKVNELHQMDYFDTSVRATFKKDYTNIQKLLRKSPLE